jgi:hypothetical protein
VLAAGSTEAPDDDQWPTDMTLTRFLADGQVDELFGNGGTALADFGGLGTSPRSRASTVLVQADGKAVVVGPHGLQLGLARFESGGPGFAGLIGLTVDERTIDDGDTQLEFTVHRTGGSTGAVSVEYTTIERAARSGIDFAPAEGSLIWEDSDTTDRTIVVALLADSFSEAQAQFDLELLSPTGGAVLATSRVTVDTLVTESVETVPASASASAAATTSTPAATSSGGGSFGPLPALLLALLCVLRSWRAATPRLERTRSL